MLPPHQQAMLVRAPKTRSTPWQKLAKLLEPAAEMMRADAGFHADQTRRHIREPRFYLATGPLLPQHDGTPLIETDDVERVLDDIDADKGD